MKNVHVLLVLLLLSNATSAIPAETAPQRTEMSSGIDITIETSRSLPTVGSGLGVTAEIHNVSNKTLYFKERSFILTIPPELIGPFSSTALWWGMFPTQHPTPPPGGPDPYDGKLALQPGGTYRVDWTNPPISVPTTERRHLKWAFAANMLGLVASELNFIFFTPGDYKVSVVAEYWDKSDFPDQDYHTYSQTSTIRVAAPQSVILLGSGIGGLFAYLILLVNRRQAQTPKIDRYRYIGIVATFAGECTRALGSILLSAIVTIMLSRISETQFLVRVTVNDFWGAIAVGFVASWVGSRVIQKFLPEGSEDASKTSQEMGNRQENPNSLPQVATRAESDS